MTANTFFETFNHLLSTKDSDQASRFASNIRCFKSDSFGDGNLFTGPEAPSAFRLALNQIVKSKTRYGMKVVSRSGTENAAIFIVNLKGSPNASTTVLSIGVANQRLVYFVETLA